MRLGDKVSVWLGLGAFVASARLMAGSAVAGYGRGDPWQIGLQSPVTSIARDNEAFNTPLVWGMVAISLFVMGLLLYVMLRFNSKANPTPSHNHHNTLLEVAWTVAPILILLVIAIPSFKGLFAQYSYPKPDVIIKATGNQWFWSYDYADTKGVSFDSYMLKDEETQALRDKGVDAPRLLSVDNEIVVPINKVVHVLVTSKDVIHSWAVLSFASRTDGVPGRVSSTWFKAERAGVYYGVCSELCGKDHAFMPIAVRVVSEDVYAKWLDVRKAGGKGVDDKARALIQASISVPNQSVAAAAGAGTPVQTP